MLRIAAQGKLYVVVDSNKNVTVLVPVGTNATGNLMEKRND